MKEKIKLVKDQEVRLEFGDVGCYGTLIPRGVLYEVDNCWKPYWVIKFDYVNDDRNINLCMDKENFELIDF